MKANVFLILLSSCGTDYSLVSKPDGGASQLGVAVATPTEQADGGEECKPFTIYDNGDPVVVEGLPLFQLTSPNLVEVSVGQPASLEFSVTAVCGSVELGELTFLIGDSDSDDAWQWSVGEDGLPMALTRVSSGIVYQPDANEEIVGLETGLLAYSWCDPDIVGCDDGTDFDALISANETAMFRFTFTATAEVPVGEVFPVELYNVSWQDSTMVYGVIREEPYPLGIEVMVTD